MQHPLGFYHVLLFRDAGVSVRLHYWPALQRPSNTAVTPYHDHVWALQSCILLGRIENVLVSLESDSSGPYVVAGITQIGGIDTVVPSAERVRISRTEALEYFRGDTYSILPRVFHCTEVRSDVAAITLVRAEVVESGGPRTLVPAGYSGQAPTRTYLSDTSGLALLRDIERLLSQ